MPLDPKNLEAFARGPRPGSAELTSPDLDEQVEEMAGEGEMEPHEEIPGETDPDDTAAFEGPLADFVHQLEQDAEDVDELALELSDDQLDAPSEEPGDEDVSIVLDHIERGDLNPDLAVLAKDALEGLDSTTAEKIGAHLVSEGILDDDGPTIAYLLVLAHAIAQVELDTSAADEEGAEDEEFDEDEELEDEEPEDELEEM